jgi:hypothetical protein
MRPALNPAGSKRINQPKVKGSTKGPTESASSRKRADNETRSSSEEGTRRRQLKRKARARDTSDGSDASPQRVSKKRKRKVKVAVEVVDDEEEGDCDEVEVVECPDEGAEDEENEVRHHVQAIKRVKNLLCKHRSSTRTKVLESRLHSVQKKTPRAIS